jgi:heme-degrading monooxygenase HmoA
MAAGSNSSTLKGGFMAIAVDMTYSRSGMDTYQKAFKHMGFADGEHPGPGILFHWVEAIDGGFVVHDVWESEDQFNAFVEEQLVPMAAALGTEEPEVRITEVQDYRRPV